MRIVIAGCGRVGSDLAITLSEEGHDVSVVDNQPEVFDRLGSTFNGTTHVGLGYDVLSADHPALVYVSVICSSSTKRA